MAKTCLVMKAKRKPKFPVRSYHRCLRCGRARGFIGKFQMCRLCFRAMALKGELPGVVKSSW